MLVATPLSAAVIRGVVVENSTGSSLARAVVTLQPIGGKPLTTRTSDSGVFEFSGLDAGAYLVEATRRGFLPAEYGQRQWNAAGTPVVLDKDGTAALNLRLFRYGAIIGTVRDENEVGIPDQDVAAYSNTEPPHFVSRARSDDRGVFRIGGLDPGSYLVRTTGNEDLEISYIPTFSRQTLQVVEARPVEVYPDDDTKDGDVRPIRGTLLSLAGFAGPIPDLQNFTVTVTLASDLGRRISEGPVFRFGGLAPGPYELYVEARENPPGTRMLAGYAELRLDRNISSFGLLTSLVRPTPFDFQGVNTGGVNTAGVVARRKDLAGIGAPEVLQLTDNRAPLPPGRWEFSVTPPPGYFVSRFLPAARDGNARPDGWNEVLVQNFTAMRITFAGGAGTIHGIVKASGAAIGGTPVFLEGWDPVNRKRLVDVRETHADMRGNYRFEGLAPGSYRILATFEYMMPDVRAMDQAGGQAIDIEAHADLQADLELSGSP
jgi:hypothetical protein